MPKLVHSLPKYRKHRASGQAIVTLGGVDHYLEPHGTKASRVEYDRLLAQWLELGRNLPIFLRRNHSCRTVCPLLEVRERLLPEGWTLHQSGSGYKAGAPVR